MSLISSAFSAAGSLAHLARASFTDDAGCGTPSPGFPPRPHLLESVAHSSGLDLAALNPQPLPPKAGSRLDLVALNPQPLPPQQAPAGPSRSGAMMDDDWCGTVPRWVHHLPPPPPPPWTDHISQSLGNQVNVAQLGAELSKQR